jgi:hypothetical protein
LIGKLEHGLTVNSSDLTIPAFRYVFVWCIDHKYFVLYQLFDVVSGLLYWTLHFGLQNKCYMQQLLCGLDHCHSHGVWKWYHSQHWTTVCISFIAQASRWFYFVRIPTFVFCVFFLFLDLLYLFSVNELWSCLEKKIVQFQPLTTFLLIVLLFVPHCNSAILSMQGRV